MCTLTVWLHLKAGLSRSAANIVLSAISLILSTTLLLLKVSLLAAELNVTFPTVNIPSDVRTAYKHYFSEPEIDRTVCCPQCFSIFPGNYSDIPKTCQWKASPWSRPCNTELWKTQNTQKGPKLVPKCLYSTQSFDAWLKHFLSRKVIDDGLHASFHQRNSRTPASFGGDMHDVQDSPAWKDLHNSGDSPHKLIFGLYVDWFNTFTNKIAGK